MNDSNVQMNEGLNTGNKSKKKMKTNLTDLKLIISKKQLFIRLDYKQLK